MGRSPLFSKLSQMAADFQRAEAKGISVEEAKAQRLAEAISRRTVLTGAAVAAGAAFLPRAAWAAPGGSAAAPRIAIVGGGMAGLSAAMTLKDAGYASTIYEAMPNRVGGRTLSDTPTQFACGSCHTVKGSRGATWDYGQITDVFGEMIDSGHATMLNLAKRFNLGLTDLIASEPAGSTLTYYFGGRYYSEAEAQAAFNPVYTALKSDLRAAGYPTTYAKSTAAGRALDSMSIYEWIESRVPGGHSSWFGQLLDVAYTIEYGADSTDQSSLNLIYLLAYAKGGTYSEFGPSDEKYRITGGVGQLPAAIGSYVGSSSINLGWELQAIAKRSDGSFLLSFNNSRTVVADLVLLALPFAVLRGLSFGAAGFDAMKTRAINELGCGINGKSELQFSNRFWNNTGPWGKSSGECYSDTGFQATWESTRGQPGIGGILVNYKGGSGARAMSVKHSYGDATSPGVQTDAKTFLAQLEPLFPGATAQWNGRCAGAMPHLNPWFKCSYSYWKVGQYQAFGGYERVRQGNVFFAGEHTSLDFQGYMEGAASEGVRAGNEILAALRGR